MTCRGHTDGRKESVPMVKDSVEIMEQGACSGMAAVPIHYYDVDRMQEKTIESIS